MNKRGVLIRFSRLSLAKSSGDNNLRIYDPFLPQEARQDSVPVRGSLVPLLTKV